MEGEVDVLCFSEQLPGQASLANSIRSGQVHQVELGAPQGGRARLTSAHVHSENTMGARGGLVHRSLEEWEERPFLINCEIPRSAWQYTQTSKNAPSALLSMWKQQETCFWWFLFFSCCHWFEDQSHSMFNPRGVNTWWQLYKKCGCFSDGHWNSSSQVETEIEWESLGTNKLY